MMKGCNFHILKGTHVSVALLTLGFVTIMLWAWEKNPLLATLLLAQQSFRFPSSEFLADAPNNSSVSRSPKGHTEEVNKSILTKEAERPGEHRNAYSSTSITTFTSEVKDNDAEELSSTNADCNYAKGRWVADSRQPFYSGIGCKRWLSGMWACRLTQRTDFSFEAYRWQPKNCKISEFERFAFLRRMQDKTIAFIGDSLGRQQFQSMMCMASGGEDSPEVEDAAREYGLVKPHGAKRPDGWVYRFPNTNTTILYYWSASLSDLEPINSIDPASDVAMHLDRPPSFLRRFLHRFDVLVLNTGHHWNRGKLAANRWVMHVDGKPNENKELEDIRNAKNFTVHSVVRWLDSQLLSHPRLKAFFRTISPRHFHNGDWNTGGTCNNTVPLTGGSEVSQDESSDKVVESAVRGTKVKILDITAISELRDEAHVSDSSIRPTQGINDCLHWCLPGVPDTWNELLIAQI
ncbi:protein trichome birefringence-like 14 isoform X2 [Durio zibethinus]|uniref:Protein trichome birefringence-like 14 isoform X2 n=1 Tax=Durio zibethinus TaxID=66656 RepID=A0A6P6BCD9_DURZI|nr:protein trichome birefringence-like 14 isoform X2 [Durio zibethinus]